MTATIAAAARSVAAPATEIMAVTSGDGAGLDRRLLRRGARGARPACRDRQGRARRRRCRRHRLLRRYRARCRPRAGAHAGDRHLRGGAQPCRVHRPALHRRHHDGALARADRGAGRSLRHGASARGCGRPTFPCCRCEDPASGAAAKLKREIARALDEDRAEAIVLGCAGMADLAAELQRRVRRAGDRRRRGCGQAGRGAGGARPVDVQARRLCAPAGKALSRRAAVLRAAGDRCERRSRERSRSGMPPASPCRRL